MTRTFRLATAGIWLVASFLAAGAAQATSVSPIQLELTSVGQGSRGQVTITNTGTTPLPLETSLKILELDENGESKLLPGGDDLLVFPPQAAVPAGGSQIFRVQWAGEPMLDRSRSFMLSITQVPVKLEASKAAVQVVMSFGVVVNVAPPQGAPALKLVGTSVVADKKGKRQAAITVENPTQVHALLQNATVRVSAGNWSQTLTPSVINQKIGMGLVQPGKRRRIVLPLEVPGEVKSVQASLELAPKRP
jgi:P pilus assembly chaperone PapD